MIKAQGPADLPDKSSMGDLLKAAISNADRLNAANISLTTCQNFLK